MLSLECSVNFRKHYHKFERQFSTENNQIKIRTITHDKQIVG